MRRTHRRTSLGALSRLALLVILSLSVFQLRLFAGEPNLLEIPPDEHGHLHFESRGSVFSPPVWEAPDSDEFPAAETPSGSGEPADSDGVEPPQAAQDSRDSTTLYRRATRDVEHTDSRDSTPRASRTTVQIHNCCSSPGCTICHNCRPCRCEYCLERDACPCGCGCRNPCPAGEPCCEDCTCHTPEPPCTCGCECGLPCTEDQPCCEDCGCYTPEPPPCDCGCDCGLPCTEDQPCCEKCSCYTPEPPPCDCGCDCGLPCTEDQPCCEKCGCYTPEPPPCDCGCDCGLPCTEGQPCCEDCGCYAPEPPPCNCGCDCSLPCTQDQPCCEDCDCYAPEPPPCDCGCDCGLPCTQDQPCCENCGCYIPEPLPCICGCGCTNPCAQGAPCCESCKCYSTDTGGERPPFRKSSRGSGSSVRDVGGTRMPVAENPVIEADEQMGEEEIPADVQSPPMTTEYYMPAATDFLDDDQQEGPSPVANVSTPSPPKTVAVGETRPVEESDLPGLGGTATQPAAGQSTPLTVSPGVQVDTRAAGPTSSTVMMGVGMLLAAGGALHPLFDRLQLRRSVKKARQLWK